MTTFGSHVDPHFSILDILKYLGVYEGVWTLFKILEGILTYVKVYGSIWRYIKYILIY